VAKLDVPATRLLVEHNAPVEVRDGTVLRADIFRTETARSVPAMLDTTLLYATLPVILR